MDIQNHQLLRVYQLHVYYLWICKAITHTIDQLGRRTASSGPDQYSMSYAFDLNGNLTSETDSRSITTTHKYNALDQRYETTRAGHTQTFSHDTVGNVLTETDRRGITTTHTYDKENRRTESTRAGVRQVSTTYNRAGLPVIVKDANGFNTVHEYNGRYQKTRTIRPESLITEYTPDAYGDVTHQNNPGPNDITRTFDERRRLTSETNGAGETTRYEYDLNNNRTAVIKPEGQRWEYDFDAANRLIAVRNIPESIETRYTYDAADNMITVTDAENKVTTLGYDDRNRKISKTYPDSQSISYGYDQNGNLTSTNLPNGVNITYGYDDLDRQISQGYSGSYGTASVSLTLDGNGNIEQVQETIGGQTHTTTMSYDDWDRLESKTDRYNNNFQFGYDDNGNRKAFKDHNNQLTTYQYDKVNRLTTLGNPSTGTFSWTYNAAGIPEQLQYPNGSEANYSYDDANRISLIDNKQFGVTVTSHEYQYDQNGNRAQLTESNINSSEITTYAYDDADRLAQVNYPNTIHSYTLDKVGNRDQEIIDDPIDGINTITYDYNQRDQLTSVTDTDGLNISYNYDNAGNQTEKIENGVTTDFSYTPRQRVQTITIGGAPPIEYQYDHTGQRVNIQTNGTEKRHLYDGLSLIAETNTIGNTIARYHYGQSHQVAETRNNQSAFYLTDSLGTTTAITNQDGSIQNRMDYDVWGNLKQESAASDSPFGFTGYQKDDDTGLYYANARFYDSMTARFLREDPFGGDPSMPPSLHRYLYAYANPTVYIDPDGRLGIRFNIDLQEMSFSACMAFSCANSKNALSSMQTQLAENDQTLATNMQRAENQANSISTRSEAQANAAYRLTTEVTQVANNAAQMFLDTVILAKSSDPATRARAQSNLSKTLETVQNTAQFIAENPVDASAQMMSAMAESSVNHLQTAVKAQSGDPRAMADHYLNKYKIAASVAPLTRLSSVSRSVDVIKDQHTYDLWKPDRNSSNSLLFNDFSKDILEYANVLEKHTNFRVHPEQRARLIQVLRETEYSRLTPEEGRVHRRKFSTSVKNKQIAEWERQTGQTWPTYTEDVFNPETGAPWRNAGQPYDAHHIIENIYGGPHEWWNLHPARFPDQHQLGLHKEGILKKLFE